MKKAVIQLGASQYVVSENDTIRVTLTKTDKKSISLPVLALIDGDKISVGAPHVKDVKAELEITNQEARGDKVTAVRFKAKKRVMKVHGHKQSLVELKVSKIA